MKKALFTLIATLTFSLFAANPGGVIDPAKVVRTALQNAASVASLLLTTESLVTDAPVKNAAAAPAMPDMHDMM